MPDLPRPDVKVTKPTPPDSGDPLPPNAHDVVISRGSRAKSYRCEGPTTEKVIENIVRQIIDNRDSLEWLP